MPDSETPDADAAEQEQAVADEEQEPADGGPDAEVDEGDRAEQLREVPLDEDEYR